MCVTFGLTVQDPACECVHACTYRRVHVCGCACAVGMCGHVCAQLTCPAQRAEESRGHGVTLRGAVSCWAQRPGKREAAECPSARGTERALPSRVIKGPQPGAVPRERALAPAHLREATGPRGRLGRIAARIQTAVIRTDASSSFHRAPSWLGERGGEGRHQRGQQDWGVGMGPVTTPDLPRALGLSPTRPPEPASGQSPLYSPRATQCALAGSRPVPGPAPPPAA